MFQGLGEALVDLRRSTKIVSQKENGREACAARPSMGGSAGLRAPVASLRTSRDANPYEKRREQVATSDGEQADRDQPTDDGGAWIIVASLLK